MHLRNVYEISMGVVSWHTLWECLIYDIAQQHKFYMKYIPN